MTAKQTYTIVVNDSENGVSIPHSNPAVADLMLTPYASVVIDPTVWTHDVDTFRAAVESGLVTVIESPSRPKPVPQPPADMMPIVPLHAHAVRQIVFSQSEGQALSYIDMVPTRSEEAGEPVDTNYAKRSLAPILEAARAWLVAWGRPDRKSRIKAIDAALLRIKDMI